MEGVNDWALALLGSCAFWVAGATGFFGLAVYGFLKALGVPDWIAAIIAAFVAVVVFLFLQGAVCG